LDLRAYANKLVESALIESFSDPLPEGTLDWLSQPIRKLFSEPYLLRDFAKDVVNGARLLRLELLKTGKIKNLGHEDELFFITHLIHSTPAMTGEDLVITIATYLGGGLLEDTSPSSIGFPQISDSLEINASPRPPGTSLPPDIPTSPPPGTAPPDGESEPPYQPSPPRAATPDAADDSCPKIRLSPIQSGGMGRGGWVGEVPVS
jgi:hypothetical protein